MAGLAAKGNRFPLSCHSTGQWRKKIRGHIYYFGTDRDKALARYVAERSDLEAGRTVKHFSVVGGGVTIADLCNQYLIARRRHVEMGELSAATWSQYLGVCKRLVAIMGRETPTAGLTAEDFARVRARVAAELGPRALGSFVVIVRSVFKWGWESGQLDSLVRFGPDFKRPSKRLTRLTKPGAKRTLTAEECRRILEAADPQLRAMILLGLNCGYGPSDCSRLDRTNLEREPGWLDGPRVKTGIPRRCPLWQQTVEAVLAVESVRPRPKHEKDADAVFLTRNGNRWVVHHDRGQVGKAVSRRDTVGEAFARLSQKCGVVVTGRFYALRHTFRTVADGARDQVAAAMVMGHASHDMASVYRHGIGDDRLRVVTEYVRSRLTSS
jgi:integrase